MNYLGQADSAWRLQKAPAFLRERAHDHEIQGPCAEVMADFLGKITSPRAGIVVVQHRDVVSGEAASSLVYNVLMRGHYYPRRSPAGKRVFDELAPLIGGVHFMATAGLGQHEIDDDKVESLPG